jgi:uncharacterized membrane protein
MPRVLCPLWNRHLNSQRGISDSKDLGFSQAYCYSHPRSQNGSSRPAGKKLSDQIARNPTQFNIAAIARLEEEALDRRTPTEHVSDAIVKFIGSVKLLVLHLILVAVWSTVNLNLIPGVKAFDPFPFGILALFISSESVFLTIFVLISQNRMARQAERRSHLDLQVGMLA